MTESPPPTATPEPEPVEPEPVEPAPAAEPTQPAPPTTAPAGRGGIGPGLVLGAVLVIAGVVLLLAQVIEVDIWDLGWPFIVVVIGLGVLAFGLVNRDSGGVVGGTVTTSVGLVLAFQNATGLWATWAYAWALVGPAASGLGLVLHGLRTGDRSDIRNGTWGLLGGLGLFAVGFLFFEGVIGLSGFDLAIAEWVLPAVVIGIGVVILGRALLQRNDEGTPAV